MSQRDPRNPALLLVLTALTAFVVLAAPAAADHDRPGVTLYRDVHFEGRQETFFGDVYRLNGTHVGNDSVSSIEVDRGCRVTLYRNANFHGASTTLTRSVADLRSSRVGNDRVSSLRVECGRPGYYGGGDNRPGYYDDDRDDGRVVLYSDAGFRGRSEAFDDDDRDLRNNRIGQDRASSIRVGRGCRVVLYEDVDFRGDATEIREDVADLRYTAVGNDEVSSIEVGCRGGGGYGGGQGYRGVTLYEHVGFRGRSETFYGDDARLKNNFIRQDGVSSVRIDRGCTVTLYEHDGYRGRSTKLRRDEADLRSTWVGNDRVSSIRVDCRRRGD